jgi:cytochrome bd-type quinol oxidase subunit 2
MTNYFKRYALSIVTLLTLLVPTAIPVVAGAAGSTCTGTAKGINKGINLSTSSTNAADNCAGTNVSSSAVATDARAIVNLFSVVVGVVSVIMIIYGGFRYITSGGDSGRVGNAKNTLIYAIVGLVIVALAQLIVHFVLNQTNSIGQ